ncbi:homoserine dehydrogenase [Blastochloris sulfoviridis]|uniref:Homoserine dehydrogenase n=1 Tax=Blastochloris sulfoviridis TaxID=50712 RepID=A0A5M6I0J7_9HYPH|nr:homoserine dehydrogenase [Blastochloris sulfoviridis]KAA5601710.1 homoserine dehydrogenase [Blastochloris sulfoviridis]
MAGSLKVGLAGLGTVGSSVVRILQDKAAKLAAKAGRPVELVAVCAKEVRDKNLDLATVRWVDHPFALAADPEIDVLVELMGGEGDPAKTTVETALKAGKHVVTANKALIARHGAALARAAEDRNVAFNFEAAVAGGIPVIKTLREGLVANRIDRVWGILNGTCNYILTRMLDEKLSFEDCLKEAQRLGYAEANPAFDVDGFDTAHKLAILTSLAFGTEIDCDAVYVEGIRSISLADLEMADELGYRVKLLGVAVRADSGIEQRVHPTMVPKDSPLAQVGGVTNAVKIDGDAVSLTLIGPGAGGPATASAVVSDLCDIARGDRIAPFGRSVDRLVRPRRAPMQHHAGGYYIRLAAIDKPGTAATIARRMADELISLESIVQRRRGSRGEVPASADAPAPVVLITYATSEDAVRRALAAIERDGVIVGPPQVIRIEQN